MQQQEIQNYYKELHFGIQLHNTNIRRASRKHKSIGLNNLLIVVYI